jgi:hypothetical protein
VVPLALQDGETQVTEENTASARPVTLLRISRPAKDLFDTARQQLSDQMGRRVTQTEMLEQLLAAWGRFEQRAGAGGLVSHDEGSSYCTNLPEHHIGELGCRV